MNGFVVLRGLRDLEDIVACSPAATLQNSCLAHYPELTDLTSASVRAAQEFTGIRHVVMSAHGAEAEIAQLAQARRARVARQTRRPLQQRFFRRRS